MAESIVWLHEDALRITHPVIAAAPPGARLIHVWDDAYLQQVGYSFKRLLFLYETLCALPLEIVHGDTLQMLRSMGAANIYAPATPNPAFQAILQSLPHATVIADEPFVRIAKPRDFRRFFQYWGKAEKSAFLINGGADA